MTTAVKALVGLLMVTAPASLGFATVSDDVTVPLLESEPEDPDAVVIETFERSFDEAITSGFLDLRIDHGKVQVVGWEKDAYKVEVLQTQPNDDDRTEVAFDDASSGSELNLSVVVDRHRQHGVSVESGPVDVGEDRVDKAIVAHVPATASYELVHACEGETSTTWQTVDDAVHRTPLVEGSSEPACVPADDRPEAHGTIRIGSSSDAHLNRSWGVSGIEGDTLRMRVDYGAVDLEQVDFATAEIVTDHGSVTGVDVAFDTLDLTSDYGDIRLVGELGTAHVFADYGDVRLNGTVTQADVTTDHGEVTAVGAIDDGSFTSDYGDVTLRLDPRASGALEATSDHGTIAVVVPEGPTYGYDVSASTDHGDVTIGLDEAEDQRASAADEEDEHRSGDEAHVRTEGFDSRDVQVTMDLSTDHGDVWVTDAGDAVEADQRDDEDGGSGGGTSGGSTSGLLGRLG